MFTPKYEISAKLLENIKRVSLLVQELNNKRFPALVTLEMERQARAVSAYSSTSIEGNPLPLTEVKKILKQTPIHIRDTEREVLNYNKALEFLEKLTKSENFEINLPLILSIQKMVTEGLLSESRCGFLRQEPVFVNDPKTRSVAYLPPGVEDVEFLMKDLVDFSVQNERVIDPLIVAGIFHKQFVVIHPFIDGNGRTARLSSKTLLAKMGLDTFNLFSFENYYNKNVTTYFQKVGLRGNYYDIKDTIDFTEWLEYFTDGIIDELLRVKKEMEECASTVIPRLNPAHGFLIEYITSHGSVTDKEYSKVSERAKATRSLDFKQLIERGVIERVGQGKNTYYILKKNG